jgi:hypothetical protein
MLEFSWGEACEELLVDFQHELPRASDRDG